MRFVNTTFLEKWSMSPDFRIFCKSQGLEENLFVFIEDEPFAKFLKYRNDGLGPEASFQRTENLLGELATEDAPWSAILDEFKKNLENSKYNILARTLTQNPQNGEKILARFKERIFDTAQVLELKDVFDLASREHDELLSRNKTLVIIPNWQILSKMIGGFNPSRISMIIASTGFGKTMLGLRLAINAARELKVLYFNLEMHLRDVALRLTAQALEIPFSDLNNYNYIERAKENLGDLSLGISNGREMSLDEIKNASRIRKKQQGVDLIFVDYDQKIKLSLGKDMPEWKALQLCIIELEELAKELDSHICILAQSNRDGQISGSFRSQFAASTVLEFGEDDLGTVFVKAIKNRFGKRDAAVRVDYDPTRQQVRELEAYVCQPVKPKKI